MSSHIHDEVRGRRGLWLALLILVLLPGAAVAGMSFQGMSFQGMSFQGMSFQGMSFQGMSFQGMSFQGMSFQGMSFQGMSFQGTALMGVDLVGGELAGVDIASVEMQGTTADSPVRPFELTSGPGVSTGAGDYISVDGGSAVGHYAVAHLVDPAGNPAEDLELYIAGESPDPVPNLLHRGDDQANDDVTLYEAFFFQVGSGQWLSLCPFDAATGGATAMAIAEDPAQPNRFMFACTATGVDAKCARRWGYRPWRTDHAFVYDDASGEWEDQAFAMKPFYDACKVAARAAYCQDRQSFTRDGTLVDLFDTRQLVWPNAIENPFGDDPASRWMMSQEFFVSVDPLQGHPEVKASALERTRYRELSPVGKCAEFAFVDRLEQDNFEDARWANPLTNTPRIEVFSPNYCVHSEHETGTGLPWDCSPCTTSVCKTLPGCCRLDAGVPSWNALCVAQAAVSCGDPPGEVWPRDVPASPNPSLSAFPSGPGGAVDRVDPPVAAGAGASGGPTISGWACDPEWPGAAVTVAFYGGGPREQSGSTLLGTAYADQALALPLAREVGAACDGSGRAAARHGFAFTLPDGGASSVFVYAVDAATAAGPAAPPALLRNGVLTFPSPVAAAKTVGIVTTGWIEAPASGTYTFASTPQPSRLFVNGQTLVDSWGGQSLTPPSLNLLSGGTYLLRWERVADTSQAGDAAAGLTWQGPGATAQAAIPASQLHRLAPRVGQGLAATYFDNPGFTGSSVKRVDPVVDLGAGPPAAVRMPDGIAPSAFSVIWQGEIFATYSDVYTFTVTSAGTATLNVAGQDLLPPEEVAPSLAPDCPHDICALGDKLTASTSSRAACHPCVDQVCAQDPFCCNGGYVSYYPTDPPWDAKCVAEVGAICGLTCKNPLPSPTTRQRLTTTIALRAGMRYPIRLAVDNGGADPTTQLIWESARQMRGVVPTSALYPEAAAQGAGAGLNVAVFATKTAGGATTIDLATPLGSGATPDTSLAPPVNAVGLPLIDVLAAPNDAVLGVPATPAVVSPRLGAHDVELAPQVSLTVVGGVRGGAVHAQVQGTNVDVVLPFDADGNLRAAAVPVGSFGPHTLVLTQRTYPGSTCASPQAGVCAESAPLSWSVVVDAQAPPSPPPPAISAPRDPTSTPDPTNNVFRVSGHGLAAAPVQACDQGGVGASGVLAQSLQANANGDISGTVTLTPGTAVDPNAGWHKLALSQDGCATLGKPVFVSVGIRPPTVEFPRSGAPTDCSAGGVVGQLVARGTIPYSEATFGPLVIAEELGRFALGVIPAPVTVDPSPQPDGSFGFQALIPGSALLAGKHLLYFFQAPPLPSGATQADIDAHLRAFSSIATTPTSRIALAIPPLPLALPAVGSTLIGGAVLTLSVVGCALVPVPGCAAPNADVNVHDGPRVWTTRASSSGDWQIDLPDLTPGWHDLTLGQVLDSPAGGGWVESCPSPALPVGVPSIGGAVPPTLALPSSLGADATTAAGAVAAFAAQATTATGTVVAAACVPASGATFPIGVTDVLCTAVDPATGAVAVGTFPVTITDGPPVVSVPAGGIIAEATSALGARVSYAATATDAVSGPLAVDCTPPSQSLFALDQDTTVVCQATDGAGQTTIASFQVRVRDTTPPTLTLPSSPLAAVATSASGASVTFAATASDIADPAPEVTCVPASGSTFALGSSTVSCVATDRDGNSTRGTTSVSVTVSWSDVLPPIMVNGLATFLRPLTVPVQFSLTGASAGITNLTARLFVAPVDASGHVGAERPATGIGLATNLISFVPLGAKYLFTMTTLGMSAGTWQLRVDLGDGVTHVARIRLL